jgi:hypothetical protein
MTGSKNLQDRVYLRLWIVTGFLQRQINFLSTLCLSAREQPRFAAMAARVKSVSAKDMRRMGRFLAFCICTVAIACFARYIHRFPGKHAPKYRTSVALWLRPGFACC